ncbi:ArsR/SmtB family transcription factor [Gloeobacter violaceus]|uniref:ArsR family transcriptional regulatory protein n=1 Tax=Gloeobacter violaceus (strain ATCC 29082 / PCC 7421) TaxID=251221 RepID=Q7NPQ3_GLOVI|nr:metalloregulator ArsR/SmtB family transcription factor [Gloeobacter violaceus]BAC87943.1 ArsR family transcriptional regulatory protein [Gloeobacter violaceus PCC 7421]
MSLHSCAPCLPAEAPLFTPQDEEEERQFATLCKALGHPIRVRILKILATRATCICGDLVEMLPVSQSTVSEHLRILKQAGLVQGEVDGPRVCYCIDPATLGRFKTLAGSL